MEKLTRLRIPGWIKEQGLVWVEYPLGDDRVVELQIQQGKN